MTNQTSHLLQTATACALLASFAAAQPFTGSQAAAELGWSADIYNDVIGSNFNEIVGGAPRAAGNTGSIEIFDPSQGVTGPYLVFGFALNDGFGTAVRTGDTNRDGQLDIAVGAPFSTLPGGGYVAVLDGALLNSAIAASPTGLSTSALGFLQIGTVLQSPTGATNSQFGFSVDIGDLNGDGFPDLVVGDPGRNEVHVYNGGNLTLVTTIPGNAAGPGAQFGYSVSIGTDLDGDGILDLAIGAPNAAGPADIGAPAEVGYVEAHSGAALFAGMPSVLLSIPGTVMGSRAGHAVHIMPGVNGGLPVTGEIVVGAPGLGTTTPASFTGFTTVIDGATGTPLSFTAPGATVAAHGFSLTDITDLTGDGITDILVGDPLFVNGATIGQVTVVDGANGTVVTPFTVAGSAGYGFSLRRTPDATPGVLLNGLTILVGSPFSNANSGVIDVR